MKLYKSIAASVLLLAVAGKLDAQTRPACVDSGVNVSQTEAFLDLLQAVADGSATAASVDAVLQHEGTQLVINQQNIARRVTSQQYKRLLKSLVEKTSFEIGAAGTDHRARRGVDGLTRDILPSLQWGISNVKVLRDRLHALKDADLLRLAREHSDGALPEKPSGCPRLFVVMGGRAGAAALDNGRIYFDLLITSYRAAAKGQSPPAISYMATFFAHELHHIELDTIVSRKRKELNLTTSGHKILDFLQTLVLEGSATYFINAHRDVESLRSDPEFAVHLADEDALLRRTDEALRMLFTAPVIDDTRYQEITNALQGSGWHSAGLVMFGVIDRQLGSSAAFEVMRDPRQLPIVYNEAAAKLSKHGSKRFLFDSFMVSSLASMGSRGSAASAK